MLNLQGGQDAFRIDNVSMQLLLDPIVLTHETRPNPRLPFLID